VDFASCAADGASGITTLHSLHDADSLRAVRDEGRMRGEVMVRFFVMGALLAVIWAFNLRWLIQALRRGIRSGIFMHLGLGLFLSIVAVELTLGSAAPWVRLNSIAVRVVGLILYLPSGALVIAAFLALHRSGRARDLTESVQLVTTGVFGLLRQPMTLGIALWSLALVLVFQSLFSLCLAVATAALMRVAASTEAEYNQRKFGPAYAEYARAVPMWNIFQSLLGRRGS
jgi:protein-S-isoprenylcysteine O-methyltransferase Ste14